MHQAQPKEGHKIWLTQEADAKSWSSLKHVQPKEGRKELAPREIKFSMGTVKGSPTISIRLIVY